MPKRRYRYLLRADADRIGAAVAHFAQQYGTAFVDSLTILAQDGATPEELARFIDESAARFFVLARMNLRDDIRAAALDGPAALAAIKRKSTP